MNKQWCWALGIVLASVGLVPAAALDASQSPGMVLTSSAARVTWGEPIRVEGALDSAAVPAGCLAGVEVVLERDAIDDGDSPLEVARARTDEEGRWTAVGVAEQSSSYWATTVPDDDGVCDPVSSNAVRVDVRFKVEIERSAPVVRPGETVRLKVRVFPGCPSQANGDVAKVPLYALQDGRFVKVAAKRDPYDCAVTFERQIRRRSVFSSRVRGMATVGRFYLGGRSPELSVDVSTSR